MSRRARLDVALEARGLMPSRARARDAILRGTVSVNGNVAARPAAAVSDDDAIVVEDPAARYVSRAALKLIAGLDAAGVTVAGRICLDLGASTGGFTQVLLERGAARVYAADVGHGQLDTRIAGDPRVVSLEGVDGRDLSPALVPEPVELLTCDVSFVSVCKILDAPLALCAAGAVAVVLVKPQFEAGKEHVGKGGIVRDPAAVEMAGERVVAFMSERGWRLRALVASPIVGGDGNTESVAVLQLGDPG